MTAKEVTESNGHSVILDFDTLAEQMRARLRELEQRANSRTRDLQTAAEVSKQAASQLSLSELLPQVVELTKARFDLYHAHIYLVDDRSENLVLAAGAGDAGRLMVENGHAIPLDHPDSIVAQAARERRPLAVNDVTASPHFLPNALLPNTRAELAIPLVVGDRLLGVLDVQSDTTDYFTEDDIFIKGSLADQIAVAVQNALTFEQTELTLRSLEISYQTAELLRKEAPTEDLLEEVLLYITTAIGADNAFFGLYDHETDTVTGYVATGPGMTREFAQSVVEPGYRLPHGVKAAKTGQVIAVDDVRLYPDFPMDYVELLGLKSVLTVPVFSGDQGIGMIFFNYNQALHSFSPTEIELGRSIANQISTGIERNQQEQELLRALKDVQDLQHAIDQAAIVAITDVTGRIIYANDKFSEISGYSIDELIGADHRIINSGYHAKEFIRDMWVTIANGQTWRGELRNKAKDGRIYWVDTTIVPLLNAKGKPERYIAIRYEITERKEQEQLLARRAAELETVARVSTAAATILDQEELLRTVVNLTKDAFDLYHTHIYLLRGETLVLGGGAGEVGERMYKNGHRIPLNREHSLVAKCARTRVPVVSNNVRTEPDFLPNPALPNTRSELAIPLMIGDRLLGVLDVQSEQVNRFNEEDIRIKSTLAAQVAVALQNARAFDEVQRASAALAASEARFQQMADSSPGAIYEFGVEGNQWKIYFMSESIELISGVPAEAVKADINALISTFHPDDIQPFANSVQAVLESGDNWNYEGRLYHARTGELRWWQGISKPRRVEDGSYLFSGVFLDITDRKKAEEQVQLFADVVNNTPTGIYVWQVEEGRGDDWNLRLAVANPATQNATGVDPALVLGKTMKEGFGPLWETAVPAIYRDVATTGQPVYLGEIEYGDENIEPSVFEVKAFPLPGKSTGVSFENITERKRTEAAMQQARQRAEQLAQLNAALSRAVTDEDILGAITRLPQMGDLQTGTLSYALLDERDDLAEIEVVALHATGGTPIPLETLPLTRFPVAQFPIIELIYDNPNEVIFIENMMEDPRQTDEARQYALQLNMMASILIPLYSQDRWQGMVVLSWPGARKFDEGLVALLEEARASIAAVLAARRTLLAEEEARRENERRAVELEMVARVSTSAISNLNLDDLLWSIANETKEAFNRYYAHVYLLDDDGKVLVLRAGAGEVGRQLVARGHNIPLSRTNSLVARAARTREIVVVDDVRENPDFLPNDLLPDTRSEMAVPIMIAGRVLGVLDIQDDKPYAFQDIHIQTNAVLANQIAGALQNARTFEEIQRATEALAESEARFTNIANTLPGAIFQFIAKTDGTWQVGYMSPGSTQVVGVTPEAYEADLNNFIQVVHPDDLQSYLDSITEAVENLSPWSYEGRVIMPDGTIKWWQGTSVPKRLPTGDIEFNGFFFDITDRKIAEQQTQLYADVVENTPTGIYVWKLENENREDWALRLAIANPASQSATGVPPEMIIGRTMAEGFAPLWEDTPIPGIYRNVALSGEPVYLGEVEYADENIEPSVFEVKAFPLPGKATGVSFENITERKRVEAAIQKSRERAEQLAEVNAALSRAISDDDILGAITRLPQMSGLQIGTLNYTLLDKDGDFAEIEVVALHTTGGVPIPLETLPLTRFPVAQFPIIKLVSDNPHEVFFVENIMEDPRQTDEARQYALQLNMMAAILIPLYSQNRWQGLIVLSWPEARKFDEELTSLLKEVRGSIAAVLAARRTLLAEEDARRENERRAAELETVARVSAATTTILDVDRLLDAVTDLTKESFNLYHAQVYLLDAAGDSLMLTAGAGEVGAKLLAKGHSIPMAQENSLVAAAARNRLGVLSNDVAEDPNHLPNPLLPDTHAELAVPMVVGDKLIGVLDVQSEIIGRFGDNDLRIMTTLADQIAVAVENAFAFAESQRQAERERETAERLREVDRLKSQFLANMSHELRTPLNSIIGYSEVLLDGVDGDLGEEALEDVNAIHSSGKHLLAIINEILDLAKIEARQMKLDLERLELGPLVTEIVRSGQVLTKDKDVQIALIEENSVGPVHADKLRLRQIIWNLFSNAVKFTERGTVTVYYGRVDEDMAYIKVVDTGVGIPQDKLGSIFERFNQVDGSSTRRAGGTGLGLTITQQLVHMHGGEIEVESEMGVGSTFSFTVPLYKEPVTQF